MLLKRCRIVYRDKEVQKDIEIIDGKISKIEDKIDGDDFIDIGGKLLLPGVIDVHTHMREPGLTFKEDFCTGSKGCAKGGITTFIDMPNTIPNTITYKDLEKKREIIKGRSYVDYGFHFGGSRDGNIDEIKKSLDETASTKIFMNVSTGDMLVEEDEILEDIFKNSKIVTVHAEGKMVEKAIKLSLKYDKPLYLAHISTKEELDIIRKYKKISDKIYCEVTPHHLFFSKEDSNQFLLMKPELKSVEDVKALWEGIKDGVIDTLGTDHAPHLKEEKMEKKIYGVPGVEHSLVMMLKGLDRGISLSRIIELTSKNPSRIFKIKGKGKIEIGYDADLVVIDLDKKEKIDGEVISKCGWTPYEGIEAGGKVIGTILRGEFVYRDGKFIENVYGKEIEYIK